MANIPIGAFAFEPETFRYFDTTMRKSLMHQWFFANFEDPWASLSLDREEGWVWGDYGPHDAYEELEGLFGELVSETEIVETVHEIEKKGILWARRDLPDVPQFIGTWSMEDVRATPPFPTDSYWRTLKEHSTSVRDRVLQFDERLYPLAPPPLAELSTFAGHSFVGNSFATAAPRFTRANLVAIEQRARAALEAELAETRRQLDSLKQAHPRNHNHPPEELELDRGVSAQVNNISVTIERLKVIVKQEGPDIASAMTEVSNLRAVLKWCGARATAYVDGLAPSVTVVYLSSPDAINALASRLLNSLTHWLDVAIRLFS